MAKQLAPSAVAVALGVAVPAVPAVAVPVLSAKTLKLTTEVISGEEKSSEKWVELADLYRGDKVTAAMLETVKNGGREEIRDKIKASIVLGFNEKKRALLAADTKTLNESDKGLKKTYQQSIGAYLDKIKSHIANAEQAEKDKAEGKQPEAAKTEVQRIHKLLDDAVTKMQKLKTPSFSVSDAIKGIHAVKAIMPAL